VIRSELWRTLTIKKQIIKEESIKEGEKAVRVWNTVKQRNVKEAKGGEFSER
jgi:hypothetical protein